jgi:hypothetical protein
MSFRFLFFGLALVGAEAVAGPAPRRQLKLPSPVLETYTTPQGRFRFNYYTGLEWIVSEHCEVSLQSTCEASKAIIKATGIMVTSRELRGGKTFGGVACSKWFGGNYLVGRNSRGGEVTFCVFKDGTMASLGTLSAAAAENDRAR